MANVITYKLGYQLYWYVIYKHLSNFYIFLIFMYLRKCLPYAYYYDKNEGE